MKLSELRKGEKFKVVNVGSRGEVGKRLSEMGFAKDVVGTIVRSALLDDPMQVKVMDYDLTIRKSEAETIVVKRLSGKNNEKITIGLAGNPNTGKTSVFNALTGTHQKTGNYPGVTVEKKEGFVKHNGYNFHLYDLPGTYSLTAYSIDEMIARDFIINEKPDIIVDILDSTNLKRNLYLLMQFQEMGVPVMAVLNMSDQSDKMGIEIDEKRFAEITGINVVKTVGSKGTNVKAIFDGVIDYMEKGDIKDLATKSSKKVHYSSEIEGEIEKIEKLFQNVNTGCSKRWLTIKLLEKDQAAYDRIKNLPKFKEINDQVQTSISFLESHYNLDGEIIVAEERYAYINGIINEIVNIKPKNKETITEKVDKILINKYLGIPIFLGILYTIFHLTFTIGAYPQGWVEELFAFLGELSRNFIPDGLLQSVIVDGVIAGMGGVTSFVPLIIILFLFISFLEDIGYMSRAAFIVDKFLHSFGLHGQSFFPMMLGFGCSIPAIMACRTLKNMKDRIITIMVIPFMSCGAKLPVYILLAGAFFPENSTNMVMLMYFIGVLLALMVSVVMNNIMGKGKDSPFVMELPLYRMPTVKAILWHTKSKSLSYLKRAGTILLAVSILVWVATTFPGLPEARAEETIQNVIVQYETSNPDGLGEEDILALADFEVSEETLEYSLMGRAGKVIEPIVKPLGFDWKSGISILTGFAAKEVVVSTLGILYNVAEENEDGLFEALRADPIFTKLTAFILMLVTLVLTPCFATLAVVKNELGWKWLGFFVAYTTVFAWTLGFVVYQAANLFINTGV